MNSPKHSNQFLGVFDSGIGGLSVANAILEQLPTEKLLYFGDSARLPYGTQSQSTIKTYSLQIAQFLIDQGCKAIVVACNTASAAALSTLRATWPNIPFIGMEPAVKPGASITKTGKIGVLATQGTFTSQRYENLTARFAPGIEVLENPCIGLVDLIESGKAETPTTRQLLESILQPMLQQGVDTFILGCTHYPFVETVIQEIIGKERTIINPAPAVARQTARVLKEYYLTEDNPDENIHRFFTTGKVDLFEENLKRYFKGKYILSQWSVSALDEANSSLF